MNAIPILKMLTSKKPVAVGTKYADDEEKTTADPSVIEANITVALPNAPEHGELYSDNRAGAPVKLDVSEDDFVREISDIIDYAANPAKVMTEQGLRLVSGINCSSEGAAADMEATKQAWGKPGGRTYYHIIQSCKPGEGTPMGVHQMGVEFANAVFGERYEVLVATHLNEAHLHNHIIVNSVSFVDGKKYHVPKSEYYKVLRVKSDELARKYGFTVIDTPSRHHEAQSRSGSPTWRAAIIADVELAVSRSRSWDEFLSTLVDMGYRIKQGARISVCPPGRASDARYFRLDRLRSDGAYSEKNIRAAIAERRSVCPEEAQKHAAHILSQGKAPPFRPLPRRITVRKRGKKLKGLRALYFRYLYFVGVLTPRGKRARYHRSPEQRRALAQLMRLDTQLEVLYCNKIDTFEQLAAHRDMLIDDRRELTARKKVLGELPSSAERDAELDNIEIHLREIRKEVTACNEIEKRSREYARTLAEEMKRKDEYRIWTTTQEIR